MNTHSYRLFCHSHLPSKLPASGAIWQETVASRCTRRWAFSLLVLNVIISVFVSAALQTMKQATANPTGTDCTKCQGSRFVQLTRSFSLNPTFLCEAWKPTKGAS